MRKKILDFYKKISYQFTDESLLQEALTHPSLTKVNSTNNKKNYQRLEFLGDKVLSLVIGEFLIKKEGFFNFCR